MSDSMNLVDLVTKDRMVRKVYYRVKYLQKRSIDQNLQGIEEVDEESLTSSWVTSISESQKPLLGKRIQWSWSDEKTIEDKFNSFTKCPQKAIICDIFNTNEQLKEIASRNTMKRCNEKVKTIFKKKTI